MLIKKTFQEIPIVATPLSTIIHLEKLSHSPNKLKFVQRIQSWEYLEKKKKNLVWKLLKIVRSFCSKLFVVVLFLISLVTVLLILVKDIVEKVKFYIGPKNGPSLLFVTSHTQAMLLYIHTYGLYVLHSLFSFRFFPFPKP